MYLQHLWLSNFRNYKVADLQFAHQGLIVISGANGQGKTNLLEAIHYAATQRSFRVSQPDVMVASGFESAVIRAQGCRAERELLIESEISRTGRNRMMLNRQPFKRGRDGHQSLLATVFSPDDLDLVKGGPAERRGFLDALMADGRPRMAELQSNVDRILRQRNTLLRQAGGRMTPDIESTLDVWDAKLSDVGEQLGAEREKLVVSLTPLVRGAYQRLVDESHGTQVIDLEMQTEWRVENGGLGLAKALEVARKSDVARGITTVGPHRDELALSINHLSARNHSSQGEQRTLALALRIGGHELITELTGMPPLLLLDDVFSELDPRRSQLLTEELPAGQVFLATANHNPPAAKVEQMIAVSAGVATL